MQIKLSVSTDKSEFLDAIRERAVNKAVEVVIARVEGVQCPVHGEAPVVVCEEQGEEMFYLDIQGCCGNWLMKCGG